MSATTVSAGWLRLKKTKCEIEEGGFGLRASLFGAEERGNVCGVHGVALGSGGAKHSGSFEVSGQDPTPAVKLRGRKSQPCFALSASVESEDCRKCLFRVLSEGRVQLLRAVPVQSMQGFVIATYDRKRYGLDILLCLPLSGLIFAGIWPWLVFSF